MEAYDEFVQHRLSHLRRSEEKDNKPPSPNLQTIRFYGRAILPPLLSEKQREEMQRHRDAAQRAAVPKRRMCKEDSRMAFVQTILHSVQLRKTPTLEELLHESEINTKSSCSHNTIDAAESQCSLFIGPKDGPLRSPPPERKEKDGVSLPHLTSTTYSTFFATVTPQQSDHEGCLIDQQYSQQGSQPIHQSVSSGYLTQENVENITSVSGRFDAEKESHGFGSAEDAYNNNMSGSLLRNTLNTIAKMPDIINYPPIDGEELERSGLESSFCNNLIYVKDICCTSFQEDSVMCDSPLEENSDSVHFGSREGGDSLSFSVGLEVDKDNNLNTIDGPVSSSESSRLADNLELSQTLSADRSPTTELHIEHDSTESEPVEYNRLRLQALLKKSQEYRGRQRMLRNQAKNTRIQERAQEQTRAEESLSDKENDEFPGKTTVTTEGNNTRERRGAFIPSVEALPKKSRKKEYIIDSEFFRGRANFKFESTNLTGDEHTKEITTIEEETIFKNTQLNGSQEVITEPKQIRPVLLQERASTETSPIQEDFHLATCPVAFYNGVGKYHNIPAPNLCMSPVHCKSKGSIQDGEFLNVAEASKKVFVNETGSIDDSKVKAVPPTRNLMVEPDNTSPSAKNSQHMDQLESNLSSLKVLILDLESTLTENLEKSYEEWPRRPSSEKFKKIQGDTRPELNRCDTDDVPLNVQVRETEAVNVSELRIVKTLATERGKEKGTWKEELGKSCGQHGGSRRPPVKCILSATQQRVPDVFRTTAWRNASVLSDSSKRPTESRSGAAGESQDSSQSPSLNQSYDVEEPSGLWLLDGSGSDMGLEGHLVQDKHLTTDTGGEGQGGTSKVKRRLLMHMTEETRDRRADASRGACTPTVTWYEGHGRQENKQEELKRAHAAQVRALQEEHQRQQEELLQALAVRYRLLQSVSSPCSMSSSHVGDTLTSSTVTRSSGPSSAHHHPLLLAAVKGFLARRLLKTERVAQLVRTIRDTHQFLLALQQRSPGRGEFSSRQDLLLQERVTLQLRAARYEVHDIFFSLSAVERMQLIRWDRELAKEREQRRQSGHTGHPRGKSSLSTATQKSLERKRGRMMQKKAAERHAGVMTKDGHNSGFSAQQPPATKQGEFRANPQRVPKSSYSRPR
ncbi:uncharacterized protein cp110 [Pungitius pungitius]|uniref:uncharacterized protein cp110 n=1 Tax=Pungitius pungitius TaxID=134920 RepID=UPI002E116497